MLVIDGSPGEGGGQILRTSLALSLVTHTPLRIERAAGRARPGLMRQHLTAVRARRDRSRECHRRRGGIEDHRVSPREVTPGDYPFAIGTAGSMTLVLQTVLPALMSATGRA